MVIYADHSAMHKLGTAGKGTLNQILWDSDFATMANAGEPSVPLTLGCDADHFDGAACFAESGMLTSPETGQLAAIANPRGGLHDQIGSAYVLCDALFATGYTAEMFGYQSLHWPLSFPGEAFRVSKNRSGFSCMFLRPCCTCGGENPASWRSPPHPCWPWRGTRSPSPPWSPTTASRSRRPGLRLEARRGVLGPPYRG